MQNNVPVGVYIAQIKQLQGRVCQKIIKEYPEIDLEKINNAQMNIIFQLWIEDNITISKLSERTSLANTTLSNMLDRLEHQNMLTRHQNSVNRREILVSLTQKAKDLRAIYGEIEKRMIAITLKNFTDEEKETLKSLLLRVKDNLEQHEQEEKAAKKGQ